MRKVLAFTVALMIAAIVFAPALGYTIQSAGNQSYTVTSGSKVAYSISEGAPAHNLTADMITNKYSFQAPAVQSTRVPYSFKEGSAQPYSTKLVGVSAVSEGIQTTKEAATVGETAKTSTDHNNSNTGRERSCKLLQRLQLRTLPLQPM